MLNLKQLPKWLKNATRRNKAPSTYRIVLGAFYYEERQCMGETFYSKVAGVTFENDNGSDRQQILKKCKLGEKLLLIHSPIEGHPNAVKVCRESTNEQIGHLNAKVAEEIAPLLKRKIKVTAEISDLTGGVGDKKTIGCNIKITKHEAESVTQKNTGCASLIVLGIAIPILIKTLF
jgi:hypothetical protein